MTIFINKGERGIYQCQILTKLPLPTITMSPHFLFKNPDLTEMIQVEIQEVLGPNCKCVTMQVQLQKQIQKRNWRRGKRTYNETKTPSLVGGLQRVVSICTNKTLYSLIIKTGNNIIFQNLFHIFHSRKKSIQQILYVPGPRGIHQTCFTKVWRKAKINQSKQWRSDRCTINMLFWYSNQYLALQLHITNYRYTNVNGLILRIKTREKRRNRNRNRSTSEKFNSFIEYQVK